MGIDVSRFFEEADRLLGIVAFQGRPSSKQQDVAVARIKRQHALQNVFRGSQ